MRNIFGAIVKFIYISGPLLIIFGFANIWIDAEFLYTTYKIQPGTYKEYDRTFIVDDGNKFYRKLVSFSYCDYDGKFITVDYPEVLYKSNCTENYYTGPYVKGEGWSGMTVDSKFIFSTDDKFTVNAKMDKKWIYDSLKHGEVKIKWMPNVIIILIGIVFVVVPFVYTINSCSSAKYCVYTCPLHYICKGYKDAYCFDEYFISKMKFFGISEKITKKFLASRQKFEYNIKNCLEYAREINLENEQVPKENNDINV